MTILITGICGFVGSRIALALKERIAGLEIVGFDNLLRPGSETNRQRLKHAGVKFIHGDLRLRSDLETIPPCDWVIDAAANPSVLAGVDGRSSSRQLSEHNLLGTINLLEYCRSSKAGFILLSTNRVYSVRSLAEIPVESYGESFRLARDIQVDGVSESGINEEFSTTPPVSLYGATKRASEVMALEYGAAFNFPVWINRCGVLAGAGQFGTAEQGIFSYWLHAHAAKLPLRYIGFGGRGFQVRDAFHPEDLTALIENQIRSEPPSDPMFNIGGGLQNSISLAELTSWCNDQFGQHTPEADHSPRPFDAPWIVMDNARASALFGWRPERSIGSILNEIAAHVRANPGWLAKTGAI